MRPVKAGSVSANATVNEHSSAAEAIRHHRTSRPNVSLGDLFVAITLMGYGASEFDLRRRLGTFIGGELSHRLIAAENGGSPDQAGEGAQMSVVCADSF